MYGKENNFPGDQQMPMTMALQGGYFPMQGMPGTQTIPREYVGYDMGVTDGGYPMEPISLLTNQPFDRCPIVCSVLAILCCPMTICCSIAALICSMCSYVDYKVNDAVGFKRKSNMARALIIGACLFGFLSCIALALLSYFYHRQIASAFTSFMSYADQTFSRQKQG